MYQKKTRLKTTFMCSAEERKQFSEATAQLTISVGQPIHEGEYMHNMLQLMNKFARCKIMLDDSIQWYTLAIASPHKSNEELMHEAIQAGDAYLQRLDLSPLKIPREIIRWRDWVNTPEWMTAINSMRQAYQDNAAFHSAVNNCAATFLERYEKNHILVNYDRSRAVKLCTEYLLEECGVMKDLWIKLGCEYEVYPSPRNEAMTAAYQHYIQPFYPHLLKPVAIRFNRIKQYKQEEGPPSNISDNQRLSPTNNG